ncbi:hypothetical protein [Maritalea porphyrae]|uniref:hypothetical protein n=1 Tax=Maritalea porphyrae TaxID=880732 RepID=UPI0022AF48C1|nr:hypothetical protein [Maritalea porphyrae]MCZ4273373.1 hypothetical protein [Maritalea porphyrae]
MDNTINLLLTFLILIATIALFELYAYFVAPYLLPQETINLIIEDLILQHGDKALDAAIAREDWAKQDTDTFEQGKWHRVRRELEKRL